MQKMSVSRRHFHVVITEKSLKLTKCLGVALLNQPLVLFLAHVAF